MVFQLMIIICLVSLLQPNRERFNITIVYALSCIIHRYLCGDFVGLNYYLSAGIFDLIALTFICLYAKPSWFVDNMVGICLVSLFLNFYGCVIYDLYIDPISYNVAFHGLYVFVIYTLLRKGGTNDACNLHWLDNIRGHDHTRGVNCRPLYQEAKF